MYKKYLSQIMKNAWARFHGKQFETFSECLKAAWAACKAFVAKQARKAKDYAVRMHYSDYRNKYDHCNTVPGSYDKATKTIEVLVNQTRRFGWER